MVVVPVFVNVSITARAVLPANGGYHDSGHGCDGLEMWTEADSAEGLAGPLAGKRCTPPGTPAMSIGAARTTSLVDVFPRMTHGHPTGGTVIVNRSCCVPEAPIGTVSAPIWSQSSEPLMPPLPQTATVTGPSGHACSATNTF